MVRKMVRTAAATLAVTTMFTMTAFAAEAEWNTNGGTANVEGEGTVYEPVLDVTLPGDLAFGINPLQLNIDEDATKVDPQILSGDYVVVNNSDVPVVITSSTTAEAAGNAVLLADPDYEDNHDLKAATGKNNVWLTQMYPLKEGGVSVDADGNVTLTVQSLVTDADNTNTGGKTLTKDTPTVVKFLLDAYAEESGKMKASCASGFKFSGAVDPNATFAEADTVTVKTTFTLNTVSANQKKENFEPYTVNSVDFDASVVQDKAASGGGA